MKRTPENEVRELATQLVERLVQRWPEWSVQLREQAQRPPVNEEMAFSIDVPHRSGHTLQVAVRRHCEIEVRYADGQPPGPAEMLFALAHVPTEDGVEDIVQYVGRIRTGKIVVVRERIPWWARLLRGDAIGSTLRFVDSDTAVRWRHRWRCVYSWE